jgi:hypothetical protein
LRLGRAATTFIHVVQHNVNEDVGGVFDTSALQRKRTKLISHTIPAKELAEVYAANLKCLEVLEDIKGDG